MDWVSVLTIAGINIGLISWLRSDIRESRSEMKHDMREFTCEIRSWKDEVNKEMKDFHGRLCAIEERSRRNQ